MGDAEVVGGEGTGVPMGLAEADAGVVELAAGRAGGEEEENRGRTRGSSGESGVEVRDGGGGEQRGVDSGAGEGVGDEGSRGLLGGVEKDEVAVRRSEEGDQWEIREAGFVVESGESGGCEEREGGVEEEGREVKRGAEAAPPAADGGEGGEVAEGEEAAGDEEEEEVGEVGPRGGGEGHGGGFCYFWLAEEGGR